MASCRVQSQKLGCRIRMPRLGFGTWRTENTKNGELALYKALEIGYR